MTGNFMQKLSTVIVALKALHKINLVKNRAWVVGTNKASLLLRSYDSLWFPGRGSQGFFFFFQELWPWFTACAIYSKLP